MSQYDRLFNRNMPNCMPSMKKDSETGEPLEYALPNLGEGFWLMHQDIVPESKISMTHIWIHESTDPQLWVNQHQHETDEILIFTGSNPDDPHDLGAEVYLDIEGERHTITTSGAVYIPAGTKHCPLGWNKIERPFRFSALLLSPDYYAKD